MTIQPAHTMPVSPRTLVLALMAASLGLLFTPALHAQPADTVVDSQLPYSETYSGMVDVGTSPLRLWFQSGGYGQEEVQTSIGTRAAVPIDSGIMFFDAQYNLKNSRTIGVNVGGGLRWYHEGLTGETQILGLSAWYDGDETSNENYFNQIGLSLECLSDDWDFRANANLPFANKTRTGGDTIVTDDLSYSENYLSQVTWVPTDYAMTSVDAEVARRLFDHNVWAFVGGYHLDGDNGSTVGYKAGVRGYVWNDLLLHITVSDDDIFDTSVAFGLTWFPGRTGQFSSWPHEIEDRIREPVLRNNYVVTQQMLVETPVSLTDLDGDLIRVVHVDSTAAAPGDGTFETPLTSLDDVFATSLQGDIVLVHSGSTHTGEAVTLQDEQRLLGEGNDETHNVVTAEFGVVELPETSAGALSGAIPTITNVAGTDAVTLSPGSVEVEDFAGMEVSNLIIDGGDRGIYSPTGVANVDINRMTIRNTTGNGIELTPLVETLVDTTPRVRFTPTIDQVSFDNIGGDDIFLDATTAEPPSTPVVESITVNEVTTLNGNGRGINIVSNKSLVNITDYTYDGGATATGAMLFSQAEGNVFVGEATIENGTGPGIEIPTSDVAFLFDDMTITDTGGPAMLVDGGTTVVTFNGMITQGANASVLAVSGGHTGTLTFNEQETGFGVISATNGDGLQFDNADGTYNFNHAVALNGGDAGIDILNDSAGTFTFTDTTITDPTGTAFRLDGGTANVFYTGKITQNNNATTVSISNEHSGFVSFNESVADAGVIEATDGDGLQFDDADGTYNFNHAVALNGGDAGIDILNDSAGTFTFTDTTITDPTGTAFRLDGGTANVFYTGKITQNNNATTVSISNEHSGFVSFNESVADAGVIEATDGDGLQFDDADGTYNFNHAVALNGGDAGIDILNDSAGTFTFTDTTITDPTGTAFRLDGGTANVFYTGKITQNNNATTVSISNEHSGFVSFNESVADAGVIEATDGDGLQFDDVDGTYNFNHKVELAGGDAGIDILGGSNGTFTFTDTTITNPTGVAVNVTGGGAANFNFTGKITQANAASALVVSGGHTGSMTFNESVTDAGVINATNGDGLQFNNADGTYNFNHKVELAGGDAGIDILGGSDGTFTFTDTTITSPTGIAVNVGPGAANVNFTGKITQANNFSALAVTGEHTGTLTFDELVADAGVIEATNGDGLQFNNADGTYNFNDKVTLTGGDAGIDILGGSAGTFTFTDTTITNPTGIGLNVDGGSANVNFTGKITQNTNAASALAVSGGHTGTLTFNESTTDAGVIEATIGDGLQFDNADGNYNFNHAVTLNGGDAGIDILGGSAGTFTFAASSAITNPTGTSFNVDGSAAAVTYNGTIANNAGRAVAIESNTGGSVTFNGKITGTGTGLLVDSNTGGTFRFAGQVDLDTTTSDAVTISSNTGTTTRFDNIQIDTTTGDGVVATNSDVVEFTGSANTVNTTTGRAVALNTVEIGALGMHFQSVSVDGAINGISANTVTGGALTVGSGGSNPADGGNILNTTGVGIALTNVANVSLNYMNVDGTTGQGVLVTHSDANDSTVSVNNSSIRNTTTQGVELNATGTGEMTFTLNNTDIDNNGDTSVDVDVSGAAVLANITIRNNAVVNTSGDEALLLNTSGGTLKTVNLLVRDNSFTNDDATAIATDIVAGGAVNLNATLYTNFFTNNNAGGTAFEASAVSGGTTLRMSLGGNSGSNFPNTANGGTSDFELIQTAGSFSVEDLTDVGTNNVGIVGQTGTITDDPGSIPTP